MIIKSPSGLLPSSFDAGWPSAKPLQVPPRLLGRARLARGGQRLGDGELRHGRPREHKLPLRLEAAVDADGGADAAEVEGGEHAAADADVEREAVHLGGALLVRHPAVELLVEAARARRRHLRRHAFVGEGPRLGARAVHTEDDEERVAGELDHVAGEVGGDRDHLAEVAVHDAAHELGAILLLRQPLGERGEARGVAEDRRRLLWWGGDGSGSGVRESGEVMGVAPCRRWGRAAARAPRSCATPPRDGR